MLTALLVGLVVGFVLAMPPGPIAIACMRQALERQASAGVQLALAAAAMDMVYALLAAWASSALVGLLAGMVTDHAGVLLAFQGGCVVLLVVLGVRALRSPTPEGNAAVRPQQKPTRRRGATSPALLGVLLALTNLANPAFLPALMFVVSLLQARGWVGHDLGANALYAVGFGAGGALWFLLLLRVLTRLRTQLASTFIPMLSKMAGGAFLLCALMLTYHLVMATAWAQLLGW